MNTNFSMGHFEEIKLDDIFKDDVAVDVDLDLVIIPEEETTTYGIVVGCDKLNVRSQPNTNAAVVCVITKNTEVVIDEDASTSTFYKVCLASGLEGFCMKEFIDTVII